MVVAGGAVVDVVVLVVAVKSIFKASKISKSNPVALILVGCCFYDV